jgi:hypothetical protein
MIPQFLRVANPGEVTTVWSGRQADEVSWEFVKPDLFRLSLNVTSR